MVVMGACAAVIDAGKILLTKREDFEIWCLPGGHVEAGETLAQAAVRETQEETGLEVALTHLVGLYSRERNWDGSSIHVSCFAARPTGGALNPQPEEVLEARYFGPDEIPQALMSGHRQRIADALAGTLGAVWQQEAPWPGEEDLTRAELYTQRDHSGLSRAEFYIRHFGLAGPDPNDERLELAGATKPR